MIERSLYTTKIEPFIDKPVIKVITGIRRCGKSELLKIIQQNLAKKGIDEKQVVYINYESIRWNDYLTAEKLYSYVEKNKSKDKRTYLFIDEIQEVQGWEKAINSMLADWDVDIYITGSNSRLLSSELATYLTGRYVECRVYPLSFSEFLYFHKFNDLGRIPVYFDQYLHQGGFPAFHVANFSDNTIYQMVKDIYNSVLLRDTVQRYHIRNIDMLDRLVQFLFDNLGNTFSATSISKYLKSQGRTTDTETLYNYIQALEASFVVNRVRRYDIKGKEYLQTSEKFYVTDPTLIYAGRGCDLRMMGGLLENLVYLELMRRGYRVSIGKLGDLEVDFVAQRQDETIYVQVTETMDSDTTRERELRPLQKIRDNHPKYIVVGNPLQTGTMDGIQCMYIADFLLHKSEYKRIN